MHIVHAGEAAKHEIASKIMMVSAAIVVCADACACHMALTGVVLTTPDALRTSLLHVSRQATAATASSKLPCEYMSGLTSDVVRVT